MESQVIGSFYKSLFDNANDGILLADLETKRFYIGNEMICRMTGYSYEEIKKLGVADIHPKEDLPYVEKEFERQSRGGIGESILARDIPVRRKDGSIFYTDVNASRCEFNKRMYLLGIFRDATKRRQTEKDLEDAKIAARNVAEDLQSEKINLAHAKAKNEAMLLSIGDGLIVTSKDRNIILANKAVEEMLGFKEEEILGKRWPEVAFLEDDKGMVSLEKTPIQIALKLGKVTTTSILSTTSTYYLTKRDKSVFPVAITASPVVLDNEIIGAIVVSRDVSKEKELLKLESGLISLTSHQLRTPMVGIQWMTERLLKKEKLSEKGREYLEGVYSSVKCLSKLIDLLLNVSRIEAGKVNISPEPLEVVRFIKDYLKECEPLRIKKNLSINFKEYLKKLEIITDVNAFRNIISVIISNAIEYTKEGGKVEIELEREDHCFRFIVKDTGIGIPKKEQSTIFQKFTRASNAEAVKTEGTGLGVYTAKQAVELLGGKIWFESEENKGTKFYVELPLESKVRKREKMFTQ